MNSYVAVFGPRVSELTDAGFMPIPYFKFRQNPNNRVSGVYCSKDHSMRSVEDAFYFQDTPELRCVMEGENRHVSGL